jgi:hypothetical protein
MINNLEPISHAYLRSDIRQIVHALALAVQVPGADPAFVAGFEAALQAVAAATGIEFRQQQHTVTIDACWRVQQ